MNKLAPIVIFVFKRPRHTQSLLNSLAQCDEAKFSEVVIYSDGPKNPEDAEETGAIDQVREICIKEDRFKSVKLIKQQKNHGLANSIIKGVSNVIEEYGKVIVLEDDMIVSPFFLDYMNSALNLYENDNSVGCIHAWNYQMDSSNISEETFFLPGADCWGWATWRRSWKLFESDGAKLLQKIIDQKLEFSFNRRDTMPFVLMLKDQITGKNDSWAIRWHASLFLENRFCLHPVNSLVENIGMDGSGTHCDDVQIPQKMGGKIQLRKIPISESEWFYSEFEAIQDKSKVLKTPIWQRLLNFLRN